MINAVETAQRRDVSTQSQSVKLFIDHWVPNDSIYVVCDLMIQADTGVHQPRDENSTPYEAEPGPYIGPIGVWRKVPSRSVDDPQFLRAQLILAIQIIAILAVVRNQNTDTGRS